MLGFRINQAKSRFLFDKQGRANPVRELLGRRVFAGWNKWGGFVRKSAQRNIRSRKRPSRPGEGPTNQSGILKKFLYYAFDPSQWSIVVGPAKTNQVFFNGHGEPVTGTVPEVLEQGGRITLQEAQSPRTGAWVRQDLRFRRTNNGGQATWPRRRRTVTISARPYMQPAFDANVKLLPRLLAEKAA